jgi:WXG100 family type VII secretion target
VAAENTLRVDPPAMKGFAQALRGAAEGLRNELADLDGQVGEMLGGWRGASGSAYASAWELWHRGAGEVEVGLSMLARLAAQAGGVYQQNEAASAQALREVGHG